MKSRTPSGSKLVLFLRNFGYSLHTGGDEVHPGEIQKLLDRLEGTPEEAMLSRLTLRAMQKAKYATDCIGHFGLAAEQYCHFTSPIRRRSEERRVGKECRL